MFEEIIASYKKIFNAIKSCLLKDILVHLLIFIIDLYDYFKIYFQELINIKSLLMKLFDDQLFKSVAH